MLLFFKLFPTKSMKQYKQNITPKKIPSDEFKFAHIETTTNKINNFITYIVSQIALKINEGLLITLC